MASLRLWQDLTTAELSGAVTDESVVLLPLAAIEQHGPHLPLSTDLDIGLGLTQAAVARLPDAFPLWVLPPLAIGLSLEHSQFPGTLSLDPETAVTSLVQVGESVARAGVKRLLFFNSHGGNRQVADLAALTLRAKHRLLVVKANYFRFPAPTHLLCADELRHGLHGGALETAMMLHLCPEKVRTEHLKDNPSRGAAMTSAFAHLGPESAASFAWMGQDLNTTGVVGNAGTATAELGQQLVEHFSTALAETIEETARFDLAWLVDGSGAAASRAAAPGAAASRAGTRKLPDTD